MLAALAAVVAACKPENRNETQKTEAVPPVASVSPFEASSSENLSTLAVHDIPRPGMLSTRPDMVSTADGTMQIRISPRMKAAKDWTSSFADFYPAIRACLAAHEDKRAFITGAENLDGERVAVTMASSVEGTIGRCEISKRGGTPSSLTFTETENLDFSGPVFYPGGALSSYTVAAPECTERETVVSRPDGLLGILIYTKPGCS